MSQKQISFPTKKTRSLVEGERIMRIRDLQDEIKEATRINLGRVPEYLEAFNGDFILEYIEWAVAHLQDASEILDEGVDIIVGSTYKPGF
tara:strand:+ start:3469 stop:3738 length:270 start_codon:yes stop_codon:yes gene_type:complete